MLLFEDVAVERAKKAGTDFIGFVQDLVLGVVNFQEGTVSHGIGDSLVGVGVHDSIGTR